MNKTYIQLRKTLQRERDILYKKLKRRLIRSRKRQDLYNRIDALDFALESIETMASLEKYFDVKVTHKSVMNGSNGLSEDLTEMLLYLTLPYFKSLNLIPSLECAIFKNWKDKYGTREDNSNIGDNIDEITENNK
jgi:hypothetical protein